MNEFIEIVGYSVLIGGGATVVMDIWATIQTKLMGIPTLNYGMVGRWIAHLPTGKFTHNTISHSKAVAGETLIGWVAHYGIGILFAALFLQIQGLEWVKQPTFLPALTMGIVTLLAPFLILQPAMGAGIAACKTPQPNSMRFRSLVAHVSFGGGLYVAALLISLLC